MSVLKYSSAPFLWEIQILQRISFQCSRKQSPGLELWLPRTSYTYPRNLQYCTLLPKIASAQAVQSFAAKKICFQRSETICQNLLSSECLTWTKWKKSNNFPEFIVRSLGNWETIESGENTKPSKKRFQSGVYILGSLNNQKIEDLPICPHSTWQDISYFFGQANDLRAKPLKT